MTSILHLFALLLLQATDLQATDAVETAPNPDLREAYDVLAYELELRVDPAAKSIAGSNTIHALVVAAELGVFQIDLASDLTVESVMSGDTQLEFTHANDSLLCSLPEAALRGSELALEVAYSGNPKALNSFSGFHWVETADGSPWINTSCQGPGAHSWWPCKSSFYHPEDKPERMSMAITVPKELYAVSNGRLEGIDELGEERTFRWRHDYPIETYSVTLNAAPYVVVESELELPGHDEPVPYAYYVLPENAEKAAVQFQQVPDMMRIYCEAFGPFPFAKSKFGLVETNFWGMEHSTAVAYGSSYPAWCEANGEPDSYARRNVFFDYILIHEVAHEWWGNGVSATDWGHFWIHEGFGTYAEGVYVERMEGRERADEYFKTQQRSALRSGPISKLYRGEGKTSGQAYAGVIYSKGAAVLNTMRVIMNDDEAWWRAVREFNLRFRFGNASSRDFQRVLEEVSGRGWKSVFDSWVYGEGYPMVTGTVSAVEAGIEISTSNQGSSMTGFDVPLDLRWKEAGVSKSLRVTLQPGEFSTKIECEGRPTNLEVVHLGPSTREAPGRT